MFEDLGPLRDSIRDVILTSDVDMGMIRLTLGLTANLLDSFLNTCPVTLAPTLISASPTT